MSKIDELREAEDRLLDMAEIATEILSGKLAIKAHPFGNDEIRIVPEDEGEAELGETFLDFLSKAMLDNIEPLVIQAFEFAQEERDAARVDAEQEAKELLKGSKVRIPQEEEARKLIEALVASK